MNWFTERRWRRQIQASSLFVTPRTLELPRSKRVLVFAPHADDEVFGCGGTLALLASSGCTVQVVVVTDGGRGDPENRFGGDVVSLRRDEAVRALDHLGIHDVRFLSEPDAQLEVTAALTDKIAAAYHAFQPDWIFLPAISDYHRDHSVVSFIGLRLWADQGRRERLFMYEIWGGIPVNWLVDITAVLEQKRRAIQEYHIALSYLDYTAANLGLAAYRGLVFCDSRETRYAEAFLELPATGKWTVIIDGLMQGHADLAAASSG